MTCLGFCYILATTDANAIALDDWSYLDFPRFLVLFFLGISFNLQLLDMSLEEGNHGRPWADPGLPINLLRILPRMSGLKIVCFSDCILIWSQPELWFHSCLTLIWISFLFCDFRIVLYYIYQPFLKCSRPNEVRPINHWRMWPTLKSRAISWPFFRWFANKISTERYQTIWEFRYWRFQIITFTEYQFHSIWNMDDTNQMHVWMINICFWSLRNYSDLCI